MATKQARCVKSGFLVWTRTKVINLSEKITIWIDIIISSQVPQNKLISLVRNKIFQECQLFLLTANHHVMFL